MTHTLARSFSSIWWSNESSIRTERIERNATPIFAFHNEEQSEEVKAASVTFVHTY